MKAIRRFGWRFSQTVPNGAIFSQEFPNETKGDPEMASNVNPSTSTRESPNETAPPSAPASKGPGRITKGLSLLVPTLVGAFVALAGQHYLQMARPQATLLDVTLPSPEQVKGEKDRKVQVPRTLYELTTKSEFFEDLEHQPT
jgi:hypothetical protein